MKNKLLRSFFKYFGFLFKIRESNLINKYGRREDKNTLLFIVGAPRTGSTILYQLLTHAFQVDYINNFMHLARECPITIKKMSDRIFLEKGQNSFVSDYGNTYKSGLLAPSEAGNIWYKWIPKGQHHIRPEDLGPANLKAMKLWLTALNNINSKPLVIKNLAFSVRLGIIRELFPKAKIIHIQRDPFFTAQSILAARKNVCGDITKWWSIKPEDFTKLIKLNPYEQIAAQIFSIERTVKKELALMNPKYVQTIQYEKFTPENISSQLNQIGLWAKFDRAVNDFSDLPVNINNVIRVSSQEEREIRDALRKTQSRYE